MKTKTIFGLALVLSGVNKFKRLRLSVVLMLVAMSTSLPIYAKSVDWSPKFADEDYGSNHAICVALVTDIKGRNDVYETSFTPIEIIAGSIVATNQSILSHPGQIMDFTGSINGNNQPAEFPIGVHAGDEIVVSEAMKYSQVTVVKVVGSPASDPLVKALRQIKKIRAHSTPQDLLNNATTADELILVNGHERSDHDFSRRSPGNDYLVPTYCLEQLLRLPSFDITQDNLAKLQQIQNNESLGSETRLLAAQVVLKFSDSAANVSTEYLWLKTLINMNATKDWTYFYQYVDALVAIQYHREKTIKFLSDLACNPKVAENNFGPIINGLSSSELFNYDNPDQQSEAIFSLGLDLLKDRAPAIRGSGISLLYCLCERINLDRRRTYLDRTIAALKAASAVERDDATLSHMKNYLAVLEGDHSVLYSSVKPHPK